MSGKKLAFLGLGVMGYPMAGHLARAGHDVTVYNRTGAKAEQWVAQHGGRRARTPEDAARRRGSGDDVRRQRRRRPPVSPGRALTTMRAGTILVDHTTASAEVARETHAAAQQRGVGFLDAPVSGGQAGAENGKLTIMVGGEADAYARAEPLLAHYARAVTLMGGPGSGQLTKMVNQICIAGLVQALAEGIDFATRSGLDAERVIDVISKGAAQSWQMENRAQDDDRRQVRLRLRGRLDAQGPRHLPRRGAAQRHHAARHRDRRPVLRARAADGRRALGHLEPAAGAARRQGVSPKGRPEGESAPKRVSAEGSPVSRLRHAVLACAAAFAAGSAMAEVTLANAWLRPAPAGAAEAAVYVDIRSTEALELVGARSPVAGGAELVLVDPPDPDPTARRVVARIPVAANRETRLAYLGSHVRLTGVTRRPRAWHAHPRRTHVCRCDRPARTVAAEALVRGIVPRRPADAREPGAFSRAAGRGHDRPGNRRASAGELNRAGRRLRGRGFPFNPAPAPERGRPR